MAITYIHTQLQTSIRDLQSNFQQMTTILTKQIQNSNHLNHQLDEIKLGIIDLVKGKLSPMILPPELLQTTINDIQKLLNSKYPEFYVAHTQVDQIYKSDKFLYARQNNSLFITIKLPISAHKHNLKLYDIMSFPVPINSTSTQATQLLDLPNHFVISADQQFYTMLTNTELNKCSGDSSTHCFFNKASIPITTESCILALFTNSKEKVHALCDFRFLHDAIKPSIHELGVSSVVVYRSPILSMECAKQHKMVKGCDYCIFALPCRCSLITEKFFFPPRLTSCHTQTNNITKLHPSQLNHAKAMPTNVPSFIYKQPAKPVETPETFNIEFEVAWDHIIFLLCLLNFIWFLVNAYSIIKQNNLNKSMIKLEITSGDLCVLLSVVQLPLFPVKCHIEQPSDITNLSIQGPLYARKLHLNLENLSVTNTLTNKTLKIPESIKLNFFESIRLKKILRKTFFVYIHVQHNGFLRLLSAHHSDVSTLLENP